MYTYSVATEPAPAPRLPAPKGSNALAASQWDTSDEENPSDGDKAAAAAAATQDTTVVAAAAAGMEVDETIGAIVGTMTVTGTTTDGDTTTEAVAAGSEIATTSHRMTLAMSHRTAVNACTMCTTFPATLRARRRSASVDSRWRSQRRAN